MTSLNEQRCIPCEGGASPLTRDEAEKLLLETPEWSLSDDGMSISREFSFKDFLAAMQFVGYVADLSEFEGHHPDIHISYNRVRLDLTTYAINGLSKNDFILATKINTLPL
jgi:4a-hydroxytetrahydrobiopterin dehydratase